MIGTRPRLRPRAPSTARRSSTSPERRLLAAQVLAFVALVAGLLAVLGPAEQLRTSYSWPPATLPAGNPQSTWYTPLLLAQHRPEALSARIPCALAPALPGAARPLTVLATARRPDRGGALVVTGRRAELTVAVGEQTLSRVPLDPGAPATCAYELRLGDGQWSLRGGPAPAERSGALDEQPTVSGLFSAVDLRASGAPSVELTTRPHGTRTTTWQLIASTITVLAIVGALVLVSTRRGARRPWQVAGRLLRDVRANAHPVDAVVTVALLGLCVIAPAQFDDGWIMASERMFSASNGFSDYYATLGVHYPLGFWLQWLQHWTVEATSALVFLRIPVLLCLAGAWVLCRWIVARVTPRTSNGVVLWALASVFVLGALVWGMTLRSEPVVALLVTGIAACMVRFLERGTVGSVALAACLAPLALTAHPAGAVALAPIAVAAPQLLRWVGAHRAQVATLVATTTALLALAVFVGSDVEQRLQDARTTRTFSRDSLDEISRYAFLSDEPHGTPARRTFAALLVLAVFAFLLRRRRDGATLLDLPAAAVGVGLLLLFLTPSKFPFHFGALLGLGAVAAAAETARIRGEGARADRWSAWPFLALGAAAAVGSWSWWTRWPWTPLDLVTLDWRPAFEDALPMSRVALVLPLLLLGGGVLLAIARGRKAALPAVPWRVASASAVVLTVPPLVFAVAILVADGVKTPSWTLARQNVASIAGRAGCGLGDEVVAGVRGSTRSFGRELASSPSLVYPELLPYFPCTRLPALRAGIVEVPRYVVIADYPDPPLRYTLTSPFVGLLDLYEVTPIPLTESARPPSRVLVFEVDQRIPGSKLAPATRSTLVS
jgi:Mycobacterial cell wall arabinan synthesis protein